MNVILWVLVAAAVAGLAVLLARWAKGGSVGEPAADQAGGPTVGPDKAGGKPEQ